MVSVAERRRFYAFVLAVVVLDFVTKLVAEAALPRYVGVPVVGDAVQLRLVYNPGAAFGLHVGDYSRWVFMALSLVALGVLGTMLRHARSGDWLRLYALAAICGGAAGNLIDRVRSSRGVVDFLDVGLGTVRWPTFNVADMAVSCGAIALALSLWEEGRRHAPVTAASQAVPPPSS